MIFERTKDGTLRSPDGRYVLLTHKRSADCNRGCVVHNPNLASVAYLEDWPLNWRRDRQMLEVICPCGIGHPSVDQVDYWMRTLSPTDALAQMVHGCCGAHEDFDTETEAVA